MKTIGIIGGTSWESTQHYYAALNEGIHARMGGLHSSKILLWSVDFAEIEEMQRTGDWETAGKTFEDIARRLESAGADCILIAANTMHKVAPAVEESVRIPLLHIGDATAAAVLAAGLKRVLFLGTRYTMEDPFLTGHLSNQGLEVVVPDSGDIAAINRIIYEELCIGKVEADSREILLDIISKYRFSAQSHEKKMIEGVILGCTELGMILEPEHTDLPLFDTTAIHVEAALHFALD